MEFEEQKQLRALWAAVLYLAIQDVLVSGSRRGSNAKSAERWIFEAGHESNGFECICEILDIDPGQVRAKVHAMMDQAAGGVPRRNIIPSRNGK